MIEMKDVEEQIEEKRNLLYSVAQRHSFSSPEMQAASQELDELLNLYERLRHAAG